MEERKAEIKKYEGKRKKWRKEPRRENKDKRNQNPIIEY